VTTTPSDHASGGSALPPDADGGVSIIVANAVPKARERLITLLRERGHAGVHAAEDRAEVLGLLEDHPATGIVLADLAMPEREGLAICRELASASDGGAIVVLATVPGGDDAAKLATLGLRAGALDVLELPGSPDAILKGVEMAMQVHMARVTCAATQTLVRALEQIQGALDGVGEAAWLAVDPSSRLILHVSPGLVRLSGHEAGELVGQSWQLLQVDGRAADGATRPPAPTSALPALRCKDGTVYPAALVPSVGLWKGRPVYCLRLAPEPSVRAAGAQSGADFYRDLDQSLQHCPLGVIVWDTAKRILLWSGSCPQLFCRPAETVQGRLVRDVCELREAELDKLEAMVEDLMNGGASRRVVETHDEPPDGEPRVLRWISHPIAHQGGEGPAVLSLVEDISAQQMLEAQMMQRTLHDELTGLPNRVLYNERLVIALANARRNGHPVAVLCLGLNRFKSVNENMGHGTGDVLLRAVGQRVSAKLRGADTVARFGDDQFAVLLPEVDGPEGARVVALKILSVFEAPFAEQAGEEIFLSASLGGSLYPLHGDSPEQLVKDAEAAMYTAKQRTGNTYECYESPPADSAINRVVLESNLRRALARHEFVLHYQPKVDARTERICGMEVLVRWRHPRLGLVSPAQFIPLAEETGLIVPIGEWVMRTACQQNKLWQNKGLPPIQLAVNLSARQFYQPNLLDSIRYILMQTGLDPSYLQVEITESISMNNVESVIATLRLLSGLKVGIAIDDFGTGHSSLSYLKRFPVDALKIDQSFVRDISVTPDSNALLLATLEMARSLRLKVVAEGVETEAQRAFLTAHGCDEMQGFLYARPLPAPDFERLLLEAKALMQYDDALVVL